MRFLSIWFATQFVLKAKNREEFYSHVDLIIVTHCSVMYILVVIVLFIINVFLHSSLVSTLS